MKSANDIQTRALRRFRNLVRLKKDPRFVSVLGRLCQAGLLQSRNAVYTTRPFRIADALWAGDVEPRILELLPAIVLKKPGLLRRPHDLPEDLKRCVDAVRKGETPQTFRGVPPQKYVYWVDKIGHRGKTPSQLKTFRFQSDDRERLKRLQALLGESESAIIRRALEDLETRVR